MPRQHIAPNGVSIDAHDKFSTTRAMACHIKATDGNIQRCEKRTAHIWKLAQQALNEKPADDGDLLSGSSYYAKMGFASLEQRATEVLHYKNGNMEKAKTLFRRWWKSAKDDYDRDNKADARFKRDQPEAWTASQKMQRDMLLRDAARYEQMAKRAYAEAAELGASIPANASPERVMELKTIMQQNHPDKRGDVDIFQAAAKELEAIRAAA